jgi:Rubrerythrin
MSGRYDNRYNEKRPILSFRVSPEVKDRLSELQDGTDKTIGEIAENVITDAMTSPDKNHNSTTGHNNYDNGYSNGFNDGLNSNNKKNNSDDIYKNGVKDGSKKVKNEIKNMINSNRTKINGDFKKLFDKYLEQHRTECENCHGTFINEDFDYCPYCQTEFDKNDSGSEDTSVLGFDFSSSDNKIPILSDILNWLGLNREDTEITAEEKIQDDRKINFIGGDKSNLNNIKHEKEYKCHECGFEFDGQSKFCPNCGVEFYWD